MVIFFLSSLIVVTNHKFCLHDKNCCFFLMAGNVYFGWVSLHWFWLKWALQSKSHACHVAHCTDQFIWLGHVVLQRWSRLPNMDNGKLASMLCTLRPALLEFWEPVFPGSNPLVRFITWYPFYEGTPIGPVAFLELLGYGPALGPTLKKPLWRTHLVGETYDKYSVYFGLWVKMD